MDRLKHDDESAHNTGGGDRNAEGDAFDPGWAGADQTQCQRIERHGDDGTAGIGALDAEFEHGQHDQRAGERHSHAQGQIDDTEMQCGGHVRRVDISEIDAEAMISEDEDQAEEERQAAHGLVAAALEGIVVELIERDTEPIEGRRDEHAAQHRVDVQGLIQHVDGIGTQDREGRMRDIDDIEQPEGDRGPAAQGGIEAAEQKPGNQGVREKLEGDDHRFSPDVGTPSFGEEAPTRSPAFYFRALSKG